MFSNLTLAGLDIKSSVRTGLLVRVDGWSLLLVENIDDISVNIGSSGVFSVIGNSKWDLVEQKSQFVLFQLSFQSHYHVDSL